MDPVFSLGIEIPPPGSRDRLRALHRQLQAAILDGRLRPGLRLPASRALAEGLGVSRNTAVAAYDLLLSEGYLFGRPGAGTFVADILPRRAAMAAPAADAADRRLAAFWRDLPQPPASPGLAEFDFGAGLPDKSLFPFPVWRRLSARALRQLERVPTVYAAPEGQPALRAAVARHVSFARAVACAAGDVIVTGGAQQAFDLLARILVTPGETVVAVEDPGHPPTRRAFAAAGAVLAPVPVDDEGMVVELIPPGASVVCVTPSHQFPLGSTLSPRRRARLLDLARAGDAVVIEDDYDGEFRFGSRPLDALQTLDRSGAVFYVGTFAKSLFPALRLGYVVAPPWAHRALAAAREVADAHGPVLPQETLAAFIDEGHLARHIRRMRKVYEHRREALLAALARHFGGRLVPIPATAGLHLAARLTDGGSAAEAAARAAAVGVRAVPLQRFALEPDAAPNGFVFGYGLIAAERIDEGIGRLAAVTG